MSLSSILVISTNHNDHILLSESFTKCDIPLQQIANSVEQEVVREIESTVFNGSNLPSLILLDLDDSQGYRFGLIAQLKQHTRTNKTPIIVYSQNSDSSFVERAYSLGATSFIKRPSSWYSFAQLLCSYWSSSALRLPVERGDSHREQIRQGVQSHNQTYYPRSPSE